MTRSACGTCWTPPVKLSHLHEGGRAVTSTPIANSSRARDHQVWLLSSSHDGPLRWKHVHDRECSERVDGEHEVTQRSQKQNELRFATAAARLMNMQWMLVAREEYDGGPDFIVHEGTHGFGLEVHEIFSGATTRQRGSNLKMHQVRTQSLIDRIRQRYESIANGVRLYVKFAGDLHRDCIEPIVQCLLEMNLREKKFPHAEVRVLEHAPTHLKLFVRRLPDDWPCDRLSRPDWFSVTDSGGWREQGSRKILQAVATKSTKISRYRENVARESHLGGPEEADVRLLVIADHMWNYG